jgi:hypothetical protein
MMDGCTESMMIMTTEEIKGNMETEKLTKKGMRKEKVWV